MKKTIITLMTLLAITTNLLSAEKVGDITKVGETSFMFVKEFNTPALNEQFQKNMNIMQRYAQAIDSLKKKLDETKDDKLKKDLELKIRQIEDEFAINDKTMQKYYSFSSARKYRMVSIESNICQVLTNDEFSTLRDSDGQNLDPNKIVELNSAKVYRKKNLKGTKENLDLQRTLNFTIIKKQEIDALREEIGKTTNPQQQLELTKKLGDLEEAIKQNEDSLKEKYGIGSDKQFMIEVVKSKLYLILTPEEVLKIQAQQQMAK